MLKGLWYFLFTLSYYLIVDSTIIRKKNPSNTLRVLKHHVKKEKRSVCVK